ncbi:putative beta-1,3-galactosyltransferase 6 [Hibiscus syriacus]|uniref:Beta-1,3-galactosyltransferase 6 n=1 Tax=Hibiscus syriacus TaxID=106335 RepID=A0A6A2WUC0_HIBSY|nr:putative beta-1,3-galactosyltransferase 6 [Hibiscus syriacus]
MGLVSVFLEILRKPTIGDVLTDLLIFIAPLWVAVIVGVLVGWAWKPKWANLGRDMFVDCSTASSSESNSTGFASLPSLNLVKFQLPSCIPWSSDDGSQKDSFPLSPTLHSNCSSSYNGKENLGFLTDDDLEHLFKLTEEKDGGPAWIHMMDKSTPTMAYQAWQRDLEIGPTQYRSQTIFDDATPEMSSPVDGTMLVQWVRKFPFFCSDREYLIGRRIWASGRTYYCVTKGVPYPSVPRKNKPRRVDLYFSSWRIRAGDDQLSACEVLLFRHENMEVTADYLRSLESHDNSSSELETHNSSEKPFGKNNIPKLLVVGGAIVVACILDRGLLTKAVIFGVGRRFAKIGRRL